MKRTYNIAHTEAFDAVVARSENAYIDFIRGDRLDSMSIDYAYDLIFTGNRVAYTCGPLDHDLCVIDNVGSIYYFDVPHPDLRKEES